MKFSTREDIEAPMDHVFRMVSDFDGFERSALRRGVEVRRRDQLVQPNAELGWDVGFKFRNKKRQISGELVSYDPPNGLIFVTTGTGMTADVVVELLPLSRGRTRLSFSIDLRPSSIGGRLTIQSLKLAKSNLTRRFRNRVAGFATQVEDAYKA